MITVPEAARRAGKNPETIRRWIREGRLASHKVGTQHTIDEADLAALMGDEELPVPQGWKRMPDGRPAPNVVRAIRMARKGREGRREVEPPRGRDRCQRAAEACADGNVGDLQGLRLHALTRLRSEATAALNQLT